MKAYNKLACEEARVAGVKKGCRWTTSDRDFAAAMGHVHILEWMRAGPRAWRSLAYAERLQQEGI